MNNFVKKIYNSLNVYERNVFGYFYDIHQADKNTPLHVLEDMLRAGMAFAGCKEQRYRKKNIYFKYLEVPITTRCSLNCRECNNLIQYYQKPQNFDADRIINDIRRICDISKGIRMLRILGGEPLVHPELSKILSALSGMEKIKQVQIVTNGTLVFDEKSLSVLKSGKFSVDISNYGSYSKSYARLRRQLLGNKIKFITQENRKPWKRLASCECRGRTPEELKSIFKECREDCHSLLNGELHVCARSSHGTDLGLIEKKTQDFVNIRKARGRRELKRDIFRLLNTEVLEACNYCDMTCMEKLETIPSAEQITKKEAAKIMEEWRR